MERHVQTIILAFLLLAPLILQPVVAAPPPITRPMDLAEATTSAPESVDPAWAYDTASGELIQNVYDNLLVFDGERVDRFLPSVATGWTSFPINETGPEGQHWNYRYDFQIRTGIVFQPPYNYTLTPADVAFSFQREMVQDRDGGPQWMMYEPLFNDAGGAATVAADFGYNLTVGASNYEDSVNFVGRLVDHSVQYNSTHVWFNLMFPSVYAPFLQILCQTLSSILSRQWVNNQVIGSGRPDWSGDWSKIAPGMTKDHTEWIAYHNPGLSPLDDPTPMMYGSGPFILAALDYTNAFWQLIRNVGYWRGWPADYPVLAGARPAGYVDTVHSYWGYDWPTMKTKFLAGDVDIIAVPPEHTKELYNSPNPPYAPPTNYPLNGIRVIQRLPQFAVDAAFFNFNIKQSNLSGSIGPAGVFNEANIPSDFFGNQVWGEHVRKAFVYSTNAADYIQNAYSGEATQPPTFILPGLPYWNPIILGYLYNLANASAEFQAVPGLWDTGFTITLTVNEGDTRLLAAETALKTVIEGINKKFHVNLQIIPRAVLETVKSVLKEIVEIAFILLPFKLLLGCFPLVYYPDAHSAAFMFYDSEGAFPKGQGYSNATMDALIDQGIRTPDGPARQAIYTQIQQLAIADVPSFTIAQPVGRFFERDWVEDWYYNPIRQGNYFYNLWKWYYIPQVLYNPPVQPKSDQLGADVNYDGRVNMVDIGTVAYSFGSLAGPPIDPTWNFRCDTNHDRKVDMKDIGYVASNFNVTRVTNTWVPS